MKKKHVILLVKAAILLTIAIWVGKDLWQAWHSDATRQVTVDWRWGAIAVAGFCGSMLVSGLIWRWLAWKMAEQGRDTHLPTLPLLGAYTFSQMGKYIPGKVILVLMRIERARRFGMGAGVCTLSTLLENALYLVSGGLISMTAVLRVLAEAKAEGKITAHQQQWQWPLIIAAVVVLALVVYPPVFYGVMNRVLRRMKKPEVPAHERLNVASLLVAIVGFLPCWVCGGLALWGSTRCLIPLDITSCTWFAGAYALSVILGMVSLFPAGLGVREVVLGTAVTLQLSPVMGHEEAIKFGLAAAGLQRLFQIIAELLMGVLGAAITSRGAARARGALLLEPAGDIPRPNAR